MLKMGSVYWWWNLSDFMTCWLPKTGEEKANAMSGTG